jgi:hypothetical protein
MTRKVKHQISGVKGCDDLILVVKLFDTVNSQRTTKRGELRGVCSSVHAQICNSACRFFSRNFSASRLADLRIYAQTASTERLQIFRVSVGSSFFCKTAKKNELDCLIFLQFCFADFFQKNLQNCKTAKLQNCKTAQTNWKQPQVPSTPK